MIYRTLTRDLADRSRIILHLELREQDDPGSLSPGFSFTADLYEAHGTHSGESRHRREREPDSCGPLRDAVLKAFPELAPLVALHLANPTGEPMHAMSNSLYFYRAARGLPGGWTDEYGQAERAGLTPEEYARRAACSILRVDSIPLDHIGEDDLPAALSEFINQQRERWQREAFAGREQLQALPIDGRSYPSPDDHTSRFFTAATPTPSSRAVLDRKRADAVNIATPALHQQPPHARAAHGKQQTPSGPGPRRRLRLSSARLGSSLPTTWTWTWTWISTRVSYRSIPKRWTVRFEPCTSRRGPFRRLRTRTPSTDC